MALLTKRLLRRMKTAHSSTVGLFFGKTVVGCGYLADFAEPVLNQPPGRFQETRLRRGSADPQATSTLKKLPPIEYLSLFTRDKLASTGYRLPQRGFIDGEGVLLPTAGCGERRQQYNNNNWLIIISVEYELFNHFLFCVIIISVGYSNGASSFPKISLPENL